MPSDRNSSPREPGVHLGAPAEPPLLTPRPLPSRERRQVARDERYRQLLDAAPDAVFVVGVEGADVGRIFDANQLAASMHGYTRAELLSMRIGDLDLPADADAVPARMRELLQNGEARFAVRHRRKDGSSFPVEVSAKLGFMHGRRCVVAFNRDVSERERTQGQLEVERTRIELAATAGGIGFWDWDLVTDEVYFSPEWKAQIGYAPHEVAHRYEDWERRVHPDDLQRALASIRAHLAGDTGDHDAEFRMRHKDGSWRWVHSRGQIVRDAKGQPLRMLGCHVDITAQKTAEASRLETERLLRSFYESPGVLRGVVELHDADIRLVTANAVTGQFFGRDPQKLVGKSIVALGIPAAAIRELLGYYWQSEREGRPVSFDFVHEAATGPRRLFCTVTRSPDADVDARPRFAYAAFDRSALDRAEAAEADAAVHAERMRAIYEADPDCINTMSLDGRLLDMNPAGLQMVGARSLDDIRGQLVADLVHPDDRDAFRALHRQVVAGNRGQLEFRIRGLGGVERRMECCSVPLRNPSGVVVSVLSVTRDVTSAREAAAQRDVMTRRLEQQQQLEAIGRLAGGIAHDFNNILAAISGNVQLALLQSTPDGQRECLVEIRKATERACSLVRQILTFGRRQETDRSAVALSPIVADAVRFLRATIRATVRFDVQVPADLPCVAADATQMHQILVNLGTNACHAMEANGGCLTLRATKVVVDVSSTDRPVDLSPGEYVRIDVIDTGVGMDAVTQQRIFEPFFTTKPVGKGTGLGLSVVHGIVRDHGGSIEVRSEPGHGTTFRVFLPVSVAVEPAAPAARREVRGHGEHLLLLDDESAVVRPMQQLLGHLGYRVTACTEPMHALALLAAEPRAFDLVITDHEMPGMNGAVFTQRAHQLNPQLPVVLYSGHLLPADVQMAEVSGVQRILRKPVDPVALSEHLAELLVAK